MIAFSSRERSAAEREPAAIILTLSSTKGKDLSPKLPKIAGIEVRPGNFESLAIPGNFGNLSEETN